MENIEELIDVGKKFIVTFAIILAMETKLALEK